MRGPDRAGEERKYALTSDEDKACFWGFAHDAEGLFTPLPGADEGARRVLFTGCDPRGGLLESTGRIGSRRAEAGNAWLGVLDTEGASMGTYFVNDVTVADVRPSTRGAGLVDLTVTLWCDMALPGADEVWELLRTGRLDRSGLWHGLGPEDRQAWLSVALLSREHRRRGRPDAPPGQVFTLDGSYVVDADSFSCAMGEAVNGPCGYFGWNLGALNDCLRGRWGATPPFTLEWQHAAEARARLEKTTVTADGEETLLDAILEIFAERGVDVVLG
ncbi:barstar family protein [Streptomyces albus]|uniref:barstar family protein n=1 Tax=Streptomyces albus TaxID=1888 RepID=UPI0004CC72CE|nr:barstar family protein [Streptomyces albus]